MAAFLRLPRCSPPAQPVLLNVYPACPVKREAGLSGVKSLLHLFLWGAFLEIQRLFNRDGISVYFISSGRSLFLWGVKFPE